jgi:hypothetical protein
MKAIAVFIAGCGAGFALGLVYGRGMLLSVAGGLKRRSRALLMAGTLARLVLITLGLLCAAPFGAPAMAGVAVGASAGLLGFVLRRAEKQHV